MTVTHSAARLAAIVALGLCLTGPTPALAQSERDLRDQNQSLRTQVRDLEAELEAARNQIEQLEARIGQLEAQLDAARRGGTTTPPLPTEEVSIDESVPEASPRALRKAMTTSYEEELGSLEMGEAGDRERIAYMRALEHWVAKMNRVHRTQIKWHVRLLEVTPERRGFVARTVAVDPVTGTQLGEPFFVLIPRGLARRVDQLHQRSEGPYVMRGVLRPEVRMNADRPSTGTFDRPPLIGPFAEFEFVVEASSFTEPKDEAQEEKKAGG